MYYQAQRLKKESAGRGACAREYVDINFPEQVSVPANGVEGYNISQLMHGIKSFYCEQIRSQYGINYSIFQPRYYARIVDTNKYLHTVIKYTENNPIKEELPIKYHQSPYQYFNILNIHDDFN